ncbi:MAG: hypothetical protein ACI8XC_003299 [Gammaproteobacteria bacterium]|jgi:hypothetical protein
MPWGFKSEAYPLEGVTMEYSIHLGAEKCLAISLCNHGNNVDGGITFYLRAPLASSLSSKG